MGSSPLRVRNARRGERGTIAALTLAAYQEYAAPLGGLWRAYRRSILETVAAPAPATQIVAERGGVVVGAVLLYPADASGRDREAEPRAAPEVRLLAVAPAARGQGVGGMLMRECVERARRAGAPALTLHTTDIMRTAMRMYERMGFLRAPELDIHPTPHLIVKGYRLTLD